jgi:hypothetical protein
LGPSCLQCFRCSSATRSLRWLAISTTRPSGGGALAPLPRIMELVEIIQFRQWAQLPPLPLRYTRPLDLARPGEPTISPLPPRLLPLLLPLLLLLPLPRLRRHTCKTGPPATMSSWPGGSPIQPGVSRTWRLLAARSRPAVTTAPKCCVSRTYSVANVIQVVVDTLHTAPSLKPKCLELPNS